MQLHLAAVVPSTSRASPRARVPARLAPFLAEALRDPRFASLWTGGGEGRAYAAACLAMSRLRTTTASGRRARYEAIVTRRRRELLSELSGAALPEAALGILGRCAWAELSAISWRRLLRLVAGGALLRVPAGEASLRVVADDLRRALVHAPHVGPRLVQQLPVIPTPLRTPAMLDIADRCSLPRELWERLAEDLARAKPDRRAALAREAAGVQSYAGLRDLVVRTGDAARDATPFPAGPDLGPRFVQLRDPPAMRHEGKVMLNCLGDHVDDAAAGVRVYYRWEGNRERASVSLWRISDGYVVDQLAGVENDDLSRETNAAISEDLVAALGPGVLNWRRIPAPPPVPPAPAGLGRVARLGARTFPQEERARIATALRTIRAARRRSEAGGFLILESGALYVQAFALVHSPAFLVEVASHHAVPAAAAYLDPHATRLLEDAGFAWPRPGRNFARRFPLPDETGCERLADALLGLLHGLFGLSGDRRPRLKINVP